MTAIIAVAAVGVFALGLSLTLIFKGHNIKSEIGDNEHMRERGIKCAIQTMREEAGETSRDECAAPLPDCPPAGCSSCAAASGGHAE